MTRFDLDMDGSMEPSEHGLWVRYEDAQQQDFSDAYQGAMEDLAIWKKRALEAEELNRKFIADINGQTFMGEPAQQARSDYRDWDYQDLQDKDPELVEQPAQQQEPVAWKDEQGNVRMTLNAGEIQSSVGYVYSVHGERIKNACIRSDIPNGTPLYTSPPASKPWVSLTDEDIRPMCKQDWVFETVKQWAQVIEAKLREKNA